MTKFTLHSSTGEKKEIDNKVEEKTNHEDCLEFLQNMLNFFKNEYDKKIDSVAIITTHEGEIEELNFSLAGFNLPSDNLILLMEKIKLKLLLEETNSY